MPCRPLVSYPPRSTRLPPVRTVAPPRLKQRLGHSSTAAAQRYMHAVKGRDEQIAKALSRMAKKGDATKLPKSL